MLSLSSNHKSSQLANNVHLQTIYSRQCQSCFKNQDQIKQNLNIFYQIQWKATTSISQIGRKLKYMEKPHALAHMTNFMGKFVLAANKRQINRKFQSAPIPKNYSFWASDFLSSGEVNHNQQKSKMADSKLKCVISSMFYMFLRNCIILLILLIVSNNLLSLYITISNGQAYCNNPIKVGSHHSPLQSTHEFMSQHRSLKNQNILHFNEAQTQDPNMDLSCKCRNSMLLMARTQRKQADYQFMMRLCSFFIHVLGLLYIKDKISKAWEYYDEMESDPSDYAVLVKNIPPGINGVKGRFNNFFKNQIKSEDGSPYNIHQIILIPSAQDIHHIHIQEEELLEKYLHAIEQKDPHASHFQKELDQLHQHKMNSVENTISTINKDTIAANNAIIIFQTEPEKEHFLEQMDELFQNNQNKIGMYFDSPTQDMVIIEAPEPRQIIYQNLPFQHDRIKNVCIGWSLSLLFLALLTLIFYLVSLAKTNILVSVIQKEQASPGQGHNQKIFAIFIAWATLLGIVFFNKFVMGNVLHYFTHLQKWDNKAHQEFSFAFKYAVGMFFTTAMMTIAVQALKFNNYYKHDFGVIEEETIMFFLCAFLVPLIWMINPLQLCHKYKRNHHYGHSNVTQHQANHLMADYHYDMGKRYAQIIEMMWFTFFYADLIPIGGLLICVGLCIYYWVDKFNLLERSSLEGNISGDLAMKSLFLLDLTLFWRFLGQLIFDLQIRDGIMPHTILFLVLSILYLFVPWSEFLNLINKQDFKLNSKTYSEQIQRFQYDNYKMHHPVYSQFQKRGGLIGEKQFLMNDLYLYGKDVISKQLQKTNNGTAQTGVTYPPTNYNSVKSIEAQSFARPVESIPVNRVYQSYQPYQPNPSIPIHPNQTAGSFQANQPLRSASFANPGISFNYRR